MARGRNCQMANTRNRLSLEAKNALALKKTIRSNLRFQLLVNVCHQLDQSYLQMVSEFIQVVHEIGYNFPLGYSLSG